MRLQVRVAGLWPWLAAALSGFLLAGCFPPWNRESLCWIALTPLLAAIWFSREDSGLRRRIRSAMLGYVTGLVFFWSAFFWLVTVTTTGWFLLAFYMALYPALWGWVMGSLPVSDGRLLSSRYNLWVAFVGASAWVAQEYLRGILLTGFGWNGLGVALHRNIPMIQIAAFTGVGGVSFLIAFASIIGVVTVRRFALEIRANRLRPHFDFTLTMILVVGTFLYGFRQLQKSQPSAPLRIAAVQANIPQEQKFSDAHERKIFERYRGLTERSLALRPDIVIWPETATPRGVFDAQATFDYVASILEMGEFALLAGTLYSDMTGEFNAVALLQPGDDAVPIYRKLHLVPFGEYIPFRHSFPLFAWIIGDQVPGDFASGSEYTVLELMRPRLDLAAPICFEDTLGDLVRHFVLNGARLIVNVTNDGWFLKSAGCEQHLANAVFRAPENNRPMVRAANTGVTCVIDRFGRVEQALRGADGRPFIMGILVAEVKIPVADQTTFYTRHGEIFSIATCLVTGLILVGSGMVDRRRRRGAAQPAASPRQTHG